MAAGVPTMVTVPVPSPVTVTPATAPSARMPLVAETVVVTLPPSTSATVMALPVVLPNTRPLSSAVVWVRGAVCVGALLTGVTVTVTVAVSVTPPEVTV